MKKLFYIWISLMLCIPAVSVQAEESPVWSYDELNWRLKLEGKLSGKVEVPAEVEGYTVTALGNNAFGDQDSVTSIILPDSIEALQSGSINSLEALESVQLSNNLKAIVGCFSSCPSLTGITIPASVSYVENSFYWCSNLKEIHFEGECPIFEGNDWNFDDLPADCVIYVPDDQLDAYEKALAEIEDVAGKLKPSGKNAVTVDFTVPEEEFVFDSESGMINGYKGFSARLEIPAQIGGVPVKGIADDAFATDYSLYYVTFPEGLETIEDRSFSGASNLEYIHFPSTLRKIGEEAFFNVSASRIDWSEGLEEIGPSAFRYSSESILTLPSTVKIIGDSAFESSMCSELYLGGSVEQIGSRAFADSGLNYMAFDLYEPIDIAEDAFTGNPIMDLDLPWDSSFENREAYEAMLKGQCPDCTVWINNPQSAGVAEIPENDGSATFTDGVWTSYSGNAEDLTVWTTYDEIDVTALGDGVFKGNQNIRSFYPHHCGWFTTIGKEAFADSSIEYVEMFGTITSVEDGAFRNCVNMEELTLPASLTHFGSGVLEGCTNLKKLTVLCDPSILPSDFLAGCTGLEEVYAGADASNAQIETLSAAAGYPWYAPVPRIGEERRVLQTMPYEPLPGEDFWYDEEYSRLDNYQGYEVNLVLPREINGTPLTMIGGSMMGRASYGDDYEMELPVRSLVIPESYTEIPGYAFANCETLETVVCYAPLETLPEAIFSNCTSLREVIFVNGVRNVSDYAFMNCSSLETVYLGEFVKEVGEHAFSNEDGSSVFAEKDCITSPEQMSDVDALLAAVKSDPIPTPTPEPELVAVPIGEEGSDFFGTWYGRSIEEGGEVYSMADFGMEMVLTLNEDGTCVIFDGEEEDPGVWTISDGIANLMDMSATINESGELCLENEGMKMTFIPGDPKTASAQKTEPESAEVAKAEGENEPAEMAETEAPVLLNEGVENEEIAYSDLYDHRQFLEEIGCICGVIDLGSVDGWSGSSVCTIETIRKAVNDSGYGEKYQFLREIPDEHIICTEYGCELYCIFPCDPYASVAVNEYIFDGPEDYIGRAGDVLYRSEYGDPIILRCNQSDFIRDMQINIVDSNGSVLVWEPGHNLADGSVDVPEGWPYVYDAVYDSEEEWMEPEAPDGKVMQVVNCQEWVSLRESPDVNSERLDTVPLGTILLHCYEEINGFYYAEYNGLAGYVHSDYLREIASSPENENMNYEAEGNGYLFGMEGEWSTDCMVQENGENIIYRIKFLTDEIGTEGEMTFSFDDPWSDGIATWSGTYFAYYPPEYTNGKYMYFLNTPDGQRYGEIYLVLSGDTMTITEVSGDAFWPFTSGSTETLWFNPY